MDNKKRLQINNKEYASLIEVLKGKTLNVVTYDGEYEVTPKIDEQVLETKNKTMKKDLTIKSIPYYETSNLSDGKTVIIGGTLNE